MVFILLVALGHSEHVRRKVIAKLHFLQYDKQDKQENLRKKTPHLKSDLRSDSGKDWQL